MEVHHHPHVERKSFKEYLLEGLMIFLAVSMGFIAENIREYFTDKERELKYVEAFVMDLKTDTANINKTIQANLRKGKALDSLFILSKMDLKQPLISKLFIGIFFKMVLFPRVAPTNSAITQLKNTGSLRLLTRKGAIDSMLKYERYSQVIIDHNATYSHNNNLVWESSYPIIDARIFQDTSFTDFYRRTLSDKETPPLRLNQEKLDIFYGHAARESLFNKASRGILEGQLRRAIGMLAFFENEYHLEKE